MVRNVYTYHIKPEKLQLLVGGLDGTFRLATDELMVFLEFLKNLDE